jgi:hypothetical protein
MVQCDSDRVITFEIVLPLPPYLLFHKSSKFNKKNEKHYSYRSMWCHHIHMRIISRPPPLVPLPLLRPIWIVWQRCPPRKGELRWRGSNSISVSGLHIWYIWYMVYMVWYGIYIYKGGRCLLYMKSRVEGAGGRSIDNLPMSMGVTGWKGLQRSNINSTVFAI